jgi:CheY-like chemotaxis protein
MVPDTLRIALLEDVPVDRFIFERSLEQSSLRAELSVFFSPETAYQAFTAAQCFDLVFIHLHFWGTDIGYQILNQLKNKSHVRPFFVATTSFMQGGEKERIQKAGFLTAIEKPITIEVLEVLARHVRIHKLSDSANSNVLTEL